MTLLPTTVPTGLAETLPEVSSIGRITYVTNSKYSGSNYGTIKKYEYLSSRFEVDGIVYVPVSPSERTCAAIDCTYSKDATDITIGKTVKYKGVDMKVLEINPYLLIDNEYVENVNLLAEAATIGNYAFANSGIKSIAIPATTTSIGNGVFNGCKALEKFEAADGTEQLTMGYNDTGKGLFYDCPLKEVTIGRNLVYNTGSNYGYSPFYHNTAIEKVTLTDIPTEMLRYEFAGCTGIKEVCLGYGVKKIGDYAFSDCTNMTKLYAEPTTPPTCGTQALDDINKWNCTLYVEPSAMSSYQSAPQWKEFFFMEAKDYGNSIKASKVTLNASEVAVAIGESATLTASIEPDNTTDKTITWTSSDETVATVSADGKVTAVGIGTATITATAVGGVKAECTVTVKPIVAESVAINKAQMTLNVGDEGVLAATVSPSNTTDKTVAWTSSDVAVAAVDDAGKVTAKKAGKAIITATSVSNAAVKATCEVTVLQPATGIEISAAQILFTKIGESKKIDATVKPADASNKGVVWSSSDKAVCTVSDDGMVVATGIGAAVVTAKTVDGGYVAKCEVSVTTFNKITYFVDGKEYYSETLEYGMTITPIAEPEKEGYTFSGWSTIPQTMPAQDVVVEGSFVANAHYIIYMVDGAEYQRMAYKYGETVTPIAEPVKEGHTFSGWSEIPQAMPNEDIVVTGSFTVNTYTIIYIVDGVEYQRVSYKYGESVAALTPTKDGYLFTGWSEVVTTMPAHDVTLTGSFVANAHYIIYMVDGAEYQRMAYKYGEAVTPIAEPVKEGHTFSGWSEIPQTMPNEDVVVTGSFTVNTYTIIYIVDGVEYQRTSYKYGDVVAALTPTKDGYLFSGWSEVVTTMPAHDVTLTGSFVANTHYIVYMVDGAEYQRMACKYGETVTPIAEPVKEGHTFSGWSEIPQTMPNEDIVVNGSFTVNTYTLIYMIDGVEYKRMECQYGESIIPLVVPEQEGYIFSGWSEIPQTMPAHDVTVYAEMVVDGIGGLSPDGAYRIYTINGVLVNAKTTAQDVAKLPKGMYVINGKKVWVR